MRNQIIATLKQLQDSKYRDFSQSLLPDNTYNMIGVRIPNIRKIAKEIIKTDSNTFLSETKSEYFEEVLLEGFVIAGIPLSFKAKQKQIKAYLPKVTNWSLCDSFTISLKDNSPEYYAFAKTCTQSKSPYTIRFGIVSLLMHFIQTENIDEILTLLSTIKTDHYYVKMALAWFYAESFVFHYDKTVAYLLHIPDDWVVNKSIQKARESYRIPTQKKEHLKSIKRS